jgi:hypothetical protein
MATVTEVQNLILGDLHRSDLTAQTATAMSNAVSKLCMERLYFNETETTFTATPTALFDLTTYLPTILSVDAARIWHAGSPTELARAHWSDLQGLDETDDTGLPSVWAVHHQVLRLFPTPNETVTVEVSGLKNLSLTAWCSAAPTLVRTMAEVELFTLVTHDTAGAQRAADFYQLELAALRRRIPTLASGGEVRGYL